MKHATQVLGVFTMLFLAVHNGMAGNLLKSPNGKIAVELATGADGRPYFQVGYKSKGQEPMCLSIEELGLRMSTGDYTAVSLRRKSGVRLIKEKYTMLTGKSSLCENRANECEYTFCTPDGKSLVVCMRAYDDGIAFRYRVDGLDGSRLKEETTVFNLERAGNRWIQTYDIGYERYFPVQTEETVGQGAWCFPALFEFTGAGAGNTSSWMLLSESNVERRQSAAWIDNAGDEHRYRVVPGENELLLSGAWHTPWRVCIIGSLGTIVESTLIEDTSEPSRTTDTDWIKPGVVSWIYWAYNHGSKDFQLVKRYIDMAKALRLPYVLIDWEWDVMANGGDVDDAIQYAREQGVKVLLWYNSSSAWISDSNGPHYRLNTAESREREFALLREKGVAGIKVDFFDGDKEETMRYQLDILCAAAKHRLLVNFHGATLPRGWRRTFPNLMTTEGVLGAEWYNNTPELTDKAASHNTTLPYTRNVVGPMDYTPCTFSDSQHPHITTDAHELALTVAFESALQHLADRPESYLAQPRQVQDFLGTLPTVWDETRFIAGYPGKSTVIARRSGNKWYIAGMNGLDSPQTVNFTCGFLGKGTHAATLFLDNEAAKGFDIKTAEFRREDAQRFPMKARGGFLIVVE